MDTVDRQTRSRIMGAVGQKNTKPELLLRSALHRRGLRYRLHNRGLPGSPDLVFAKHGAALFVHGCYWHRHGCYRSTTPKSRLEYWLPKFEANVSRDERDIARLKALDWRVLIVWECSLVGKLSRSPELVAGEVHIWLDSSATYSEIAGTP